jgi:hypothetical protein
MSRASPAGAAVRSPDPVTEETSSEFAETPDIAATAPAPILRKSLRLAFIFAPLIALIDWKHDQAAGSFLLDISFR